jgi:hypothetical protein
MADNQAGIMALPENQDVQGPTLGLDDTYDAVKQALGAARPDAAESMDSEMSGIRGFADDLTDEQLDSMLQLIQYLYSNKDNYKQLVSDLVNDGVVDEGDLPAEYDATFLSTFGTILLEERRSRGTDRPPFPEKFARGGIADAARIVANQGRSGDTMLAHITPEEARMLRKMGGVGTINPVTGLPEFAWYSAITKPFKAAVGLVKSAFKTVAGAVKSVVSSPVGRVVATIALATFLGPGALGITGLGLSSGVAAATAAGTVSLASGESVKDAVKSAAFAYFVTPSAKAVTATATTAATPAFNNPISTWVGETTAKYAGTNAFVADALKFYDNANPYLKTAITSGTLGTTAGLLTGQNLEDSVKGGLTSAAISTGVQAAGNAPDIFNKNAKAGAELVDDINTTQGAQAMQSTSANKNVELARDLEDFVDAGETYKRGIAGSPTGSNGIADLAAQAKTNLSPDNVVLTGVGETLDDAALASKLGMSRDTRPGAFDAASLNQALGREPVEGQMFNAADVLSGKTSSIAPVAAPNINPVPTTTAGGYKVPGVLDSTKQIGGGILDIAKGDFSKGYENIVKGGGDLFFPGSPSTSDVVNSPEYQNAIGQKVPLPPEIAFKEAQKSLSPTLLRTYGPATAAGIAGLALSGAFTPPDQPQSEQAQMLAGTPGEDLIAKDADKYVVQNIPGVTYSPEGQILSATGAPSTISMQDVRVGPADYTATMQDVSRPTGSYAAAPMGPMQPQAPLMDPYQYYYQQYLAAQGQQPRYYAMGGITSLSAPMQAPPPAGIAALRDGGNSNYPRRTGQIAGPGTEKSDSIPAMLSDGEFVMTAAAVRGMGKGSRREGAKRMYALMHQLEKNAARG